ncbi:MAG: hypothetical protein B6244_11445 [Candidatus Cloacimonetes bacterium 4572_55]|nr:MAG: hypothetical protein B6244_11445 [Candidatus Cloacimonetes bacterium 4572_55]
MKFFFIILILGIFGVQCRQEPRQSSQSQQQSQTQSSTRQATQKEGLKSVVGGARDITLLMDPASESLIGKEIIQTLRLSRFPSRIENTFKVRKPALEKYHISKLWYNAVLVFQMDSPATVAIETEKYLTADEKATIDREGILSIYRESVWSFGQHVYFLVARDSVALLKKGDSYARRIVADIEARLNKDMADEIYQYGLNDERVEQMEKFGWRFDLPSDYSLYKQSEGDRAMMYRRRNLDPLIDRIITVHWGPATEVELTEDRMKQMRDKILAKYSSGDYVGESFLFFRKCRFSGRDALMMEGNWKNDKDMIGGPFRAYLFIDQETSRYYMVDYYVLAIGQKKDRLMRQLEIIISSFSPESG